MRSNEREVPKWIERKNNYCSKKLLSEIPTLQHIVDHPFLSIILLKCNGAYIPNKIPYFRVFKGNHVILLNISWNRTDLFDTTF